MGAIIEHQEVRATGTKGMCGERRATAKDAFGPFLLGRAGARGCGPCRFVFPHGRVCRAGWICIAGKVSRSKWPPYCPPTNKALERPGGA